MGLELDGCKRNIIVDYIFVLVDIKRRSCFVFGKLLFNARVNKNIINCNRISSLKKTCYSAHKVFVTSCIQLIYGLMSVIQLITIEFPIVNYMVYEQSFDFNSSSIDEHNWRIVNTQNDQSFHNIRGYNYALLTMCLNGTEDRFEDNKIGVNDFCVYVIWSSS